MISSREFDNRRLLLAYPLIPIIHLGIFQLVLKVQEVLGLTGSSVSDSASTVAQLHLSIAAINIVCLSIFAAISIILWRSNRFLGAWSFSQAIATYGAKLWWAFAILFVSRMGTNWELVNLKWSSSGDFLGSWVFGYAFVFVAASIAICMGFALKRTSHT